MTMPTNRTPGICARCSEVVNVGDGFVNGKLDGGAWRVVHNACVPIHTNPDYWMKSVTRRIRLLVEELERLEPEDIDTLRATPGAALLREWLGKPRWTAPEYDL